MVDDLTDREQEILKSLPGPPETAEIRTTHVWIIEWLFPNDPPTGRLLHEWMNAHRPGWSAYQQCRSKADVIRSIERATVRAQQSNMTPVLHLETHGGDVGLGGPDQSGFLELLTWDEITNPLQELNVATHCNLVVFVAACIGFAGVQALRRGPRAPAVALVGPDADVEPSNLFAGTKEFYRRWTDKSPRLEDVTVSASREAGTVSFELEPFAALFYEAFVEQLITSIRPSEHHRRNERLRRRMLQSTALSASEVEEQLAFLPTLPSWTVLQEIWDKMFMIDLYPENRERFGLDVKAIVEIIVHGCDR